MFFPKIVKGALRSLFGKNIKPLDNKIWSKANSGCPPKMKVTVLGAAGKSGRCLGLLLKQLHSLDEVALYDLCPPGGYGHALNQIDTKCTMSCYCGRDCLCPALHCSSVVIIIASSGCDSFQTNAPIVTELALQICNVCPEAFIIVATEPVDCMAPLVAEIQRLRGSYNPRKVLGCVELNNLRANTVLANYLCVPPEKVKVPLVGGANPLTMVPVLSSAEHPCSNLNHEEISCVTGWISNGVMCCCQARCAVPEHPWLAGAFAVCRNTSCVVDGLQGKKNDICGYVDSCGFCCPNVQFFTSDIRLGPSGIEEIYGIPELSNYENCLLWNYLPYIRKESARANWLAYKMCSCTECFVPPSNSYCFLPSLRTTQPAVTWSPEFCTDEHLAAMCRDLAFNVSCSALCWFPKPADVDYEKSSRSSHTLRIKGPSCDRKSVPRSLKYEMEKTMRQCKTQY